MHLPYKHLTFNSILSSSFLCIIQYKCPIFNPLIFFKLFPIILPYFRTLYGNAVHTKQQQECYIEIWSHVTSLYSILSDVSFHPWGWLTDLVRHLPIPPLWGWWTSLERHLPTHPYTITGKRMLGTIWSLWQ